MKTSPGVAIFSESLPETRVVAAAFPHKNDNKTFSQGNAPKVTT
jgi:hypothetical protein